MTGMPVSLARVRMRVYIRSLWTGDPPGLFTVMAFRRQAGVRVRIYS